MTSERTRGAALPLVCLCLLALLASGAESSPRSLLLLPQETAPEGVDLLERGEELLRQRVYSRAQRAFRDAERRGQATPVRAQWGQARAYYGMESWGNAVKACDRVIALSADDPRLRAQAHNLKGLVLSARSGTRNRKLLAQAEQEFRQAIALADISLYLFNLGTVLLLQDQQEEGVAVLRDYLRMSPRDGQAGRAKLFVDDPRRVRDSFAPEFVLTTLSGETLSLRDLQGKVVVLDFWATWCQPCVTAVPSLVALHKKYPGQVVLVGISADHDEGAWRRFIEKNRMEWPQYLDGNRRLQSMFGVSSFPTYLVIDGHGTIRLRRGGGSNSVHSIEAEISKVLRESGTEAP